MAIKIEIPKHVREFILSNRMIREGDKIVVAFSGGPDSTAMLYILSALSRELSFYIHIAYLNHMLRKMAEDETLWAQDVALSLSVDFTCGRYPVNWLSAHERMSVEDAARMGRYRFLEDVRKRVGADKIAVAHNLDDHAETIILKFIRGCSVSGLRGMNPVSGRIIRPLLCMTKAEILQFCERYNLSYRIDETNADTSYLRNRIRLELLPLLRERYNPNITGALLSLSRNASVEDDFIREYTQNVFEDLFEFREGMLVADVNAILQQHVSVQYRLFLMAISRLSKDLKGLSRKHLDSMLRVLSSAGYKEVKLPGSIVLQKVQDRVYISERVKTVINPTEYKFCPPFELRTRWGLFKAVLITPPIDGRVLREPSVAYLDAERLRMPLLIRNRREGDRFRPYGMPYEVRLKKFFINEKVPFIHRDDVPLLVSGDDVVWVVGMRVSEACKVTKETKKILKVEFVKGSLKQ